MHQAREDLSLEQEARSRLSAAETQRQHLERATMFELAVGTFGQVNGAHAALPDPSQQAPRTEHLVDQVWCLVVGERAQANFGGQTLEIGLGLVGRGQQ